MYASTKLCIPVSPLLSHTKPSLEPGIWNLEPGMVQTYLPPLLWTRHSDIFNRIGSTTGTAACTSIHPGGGGGGGGGGGLAGTLDSVKGGEASWTWDRERCCSENKGMYLTSWIHRRMWQWSLSRLVGW